MKKYHWILLSLLALPYAFASGKPPVANPPAVTIKIDNFTFTPPMLNVPPGTQITWINADDIPHTVVSDDQSFKSKALDTDDRFNITLTKPGTYSYFCSIHPKMTGKIVVQ